MHILIVRNDSNKGAVEASVLLQAYCSSQSIAFTNVDAFELAVLSQTADPAGFDLAVVLGGDGTILRTAGFIGGAGTPILGINFGRLGFLANGSDEGVLEVVGAALAGDVQREERSNLSVQVECDGDEDLDVEQVMGEPAREFFALNEMALTRGVSGRIIDFSLRIGGARIAEMRGDGMVVASATGSTAYALSAGGPLVAPSFTGLVAVPLAPHTIKSRAVVTGPSDVVEIGLDGGRPATDEAALFIDGNQIDFDRPVRRICVMRGPDPTVLLRYKSEGFYAHASSVFF